MEIEVAEVACFAAREESGSLLRPGRSVERDNSTDRGVEDLDRASMVVVMAVVHTEAGEGEDPAAVADSKSKIL